MTTPIYRIDGRKVPIGVASDYVRLKQAHDKHCPCGVPLRITSGYRTRSEQIKQFTDRYRRGAHSPFGDYRIYQGVRWGRVSGEGTVQSPDVVSNHTRGYALDLNVTSGGVCQKWMLANAPKYGFHWGEGFSVNEPWHWLWRVTGIFPVASSPDPWLGRKAPDPVAASDNGYGGWAAAVANVGKPLPKPSSKEIEVIVYQRQDKTARGSGRTVKPGEGFYLHTDTGRATSQATNVVGGIGAYSITPHAYVEGKPGDEFEFVLCWQDEKKKPKPKQSRHYVERVMIPESGKAMVSREFKRSVASGFAVYLRFDALKANKGNLKVTRFDCDAYLFKK